MGKREELSHRRSLPAWLIAMILAAAVCVSGCGNGARETGTGAGTSAGSGTGVVTDAGASSGSDAGGEALPESWTGDDRDGVALYLQEYGHLPSNYMTKKEARKHGWEGGALHLVLPGMCIGGDRFGNFEEILPEDMDYTECDIDTLDSDSRGAKRIVYSADDDDLDIWYTDDHYESFDLICGDGV